MISHMRIDQEAGVTREKDSMDSSEMKRRPGGPVFHKNPLWNHTGSYRQDRDKDHSPLSLQKLGEGFYRVMGMRGRGRRHSSVPEAATPRRQPVRRTSKSDATVEFCRANINSSDSSYEGSAKTAASAFASACPNTSRLRANPSNRSSHRCTSRERPVGDFWAPNRGWNVSKLLEMSDTWRAALAKGRRLTPRELDDLNLVLGMMLTDEGPKTSTTNVEQPSVEQPSVVHMITFSAIQRARLDKLLVEILRAYDREMTTEPFGGVQVETGLGCAVKAASDLQKHWQSRFKAEYFAIDKYRHDNLMSGRLFDVVWSATASDGMGVWSPTQAIDCSEVEGNLKFVPGQWWLNIACAQRDGIVGAASESATKGRYGVAALALLTGREENLPDGTTVYIREAPQNDVHNNLLSQVGQKIRLLRGFRLKSIYTPKAGVRYDGMYRIKSWSIKLNMVSELYALRLTLERLPDQNPMEELTMIPRPSQLDDWCLYEQLERTRIRKTQGKTKFDEWTASRVAERAEHSQWRRSKEAEAAENMGALRSAMYRPAGAGGFASSDPRRRKLCEIDTNLMATAETREEEEEELEK